MRKSAFENLVSMLATLAVIALGLLPIFFLPFTPDFYEFNKWYLLIISAFLLVVAWLIHAIVHRRFTVSLCPLTVGLGAIAIVAAASLAVASSNRIEALLTPIGLIALAAFFLIAVTSTEELLPSFREIMRWSLFTAVGILGLVGVYQFFAIGAIMFPAVAFLSDSLWTPTGISLVSVTIMLVCLPLLIEQIKESLHHKKEVQAAMAIIIACVVTVGTGLTLWRMIPKLTSLALYPAAGWTVAFDTVKTPSRAALGIGAENFLTAYTRARPASLNQTPLWNMRFTVNANFILHMMTVFGIAGLIASLLFLRALLGKPHSRIGRVARILAILAMLVAPPGLSLITTLIIVYIVTEPETATLHTLHLSEDTHWTSGSALIVAIAGGLIASYFLFQVYTGEHLIFRSFQTARDNRGKETHDLQVAAIKKNPSLSRYHIIYSQTTLALANTLSVNLDREAIAASDAAALADRDLMFDLARESVRQAKLATQVNEQNILAWENLGRTYQSIIDGTSGADAWAVAAWQKARELDPTNMETRIVLGALFVRVGRYDDAILQFQTAIRLKPDHANAYYNLANVLRLKGDVENAIAVLEETRKYLQKDSSDFVKLTNELEALRRGTRTGQSQATDSGTLTTSP